MGYRSDVAYIINFKNREVRDDFIALIMAKGGEELKALKECVIPEVTDSEHEEESTAQINFFAHNVKWYRSFPDVSSHHNLMEFAVKQFKDDADYRFISVGEDGQAEEEDSDGEYVPHDDFHTVAYIETPFEKEYKPVGDDIRVMYKYQTLSNT